MYDIWINIKINKGKITCLDEMNFVKDHGYKFENVSGSLGIKNMDFQNFSFAKNPFLFF